MANATVKRSRGRKSKAETAAMLKSAGDAQIKQVTRLFKSLSDGTRFKILRHLAENPGTRVNDLCEHLGMSQPAVSHHLALMKAANLVDSTRHGKEMHYEVTNPAAARLVVDGLSAVSTD